MRLNQAERNELNGHLLEITNASLAAGEAIDADDNVALAGALERMALAYNAFITMTKLYILTGRF